MMKSSRVYRLLRLITLLQSGRTYTAGELADELDVSRRTVFRDLNMLEMAHIPYYHDRDTGGYKIEKHFFLQPVNLTVGEALAILVLAGNIEGAGELPLLSEGGRAAMKVEGVLPPTLRSEVGGIADRVRFSVGPVARHEGLEGPFETLAYAAVARKACRIVYVSFYERQQIETEIQPLRLVFMSRAWYVIAFSRAHDEIRTFKLGRIAELKVTDRTFSPPVGVNLDEKFGDAWSMIPEGTLYDVHVHFEPKVAGNVAEVQWHRSQRVEWNDDGSIEFHAAVDGLGEITWWILGYGDQAEVIAPEPLRQRVADHAESLLRRYRREDER